MISKITLALVATSILMSGSACFAADEQNDKGAPTPIVGQPDGEANKVTPAPILRKIGDRLPGADGNEPQQKAPGK